ncbi:hypothetical protein MTO96_011610 [Rhipicephalus appendiculatus]
MPAGVECGGGGHCTCKDIGDCEELARTERSAGSVTCVCRFQLCVPGLGGQFTKRRSRAPDESSLRAENCVKDGFQNSVLSLRTSIRGLPCSCCAVHERF